MAKQKVKNNFDALVEKMTDNFSKIENFDLVRTDERAKKLFNMTTFRAAELTSYRNLVCNHFIPITNKAIAESKQAMLTSQYKTLIDMKSVDFYETLYDTIRLDYVGLFHKVENFVNEIGIMADIVFSAPSRESIFTWVKKNLGFDFKDWQRFSIFFRINWICNCVKHKDGYPIKSPKPIELAHLDPAQRIRMSAQEFKTDCDLVINFYPIFMRMVMTFAMGRAAIERMFALDEEQDKELQRIDTEAREQIFDQLRKMVDQIPRVEIVD